MIEGLLILALLGVALLYAEMKSNRRIIDRQSSQIRHLTGELIEEDKLEQERIKEDYLFQKVLTEVRKNNIDVPVEFLYQEAYRIFKRKYGYSFSDPFNKYPF